MSAPLHIVHECVESARYGDPGDSALLGAVIRYPGPGAPVTSVSPHRLVEHLARYGTRPTAVGAAGDGLIRTMESVGLTGHGGGHFPVATKWRAHLRAGGGGTVVANGAEGEPVSVKDRALLQFRPHLVIDGLVSAAETAGADDLVIWLASGSRRTERVLVRALAERRAAQLDEPAIRVVLAPDRYISGESSAIMSALAGGPARPLYRRPRPAAADDDHPPVLVQNVETLARIRVLAATGARDYEPTALFSVPHAGARSVIEVGADTALQHVVQSVTGFGDDDAPQAVLVGGYSGLWSRWDELGAVRTGERSAAEHGLTLGAGVLIPLSAGKCGLAQASVIASYLAGSSAGQCGPCVFGLRSTSDLLAQVVAGRTRRADLRRLSRFLDEIAGRGACHHPDGAVRMIGSALQVFTDDVEAHLRRGHCLHGPDAGPVQIDGVGR